MGSFLAFSPEETFSGRLAGPRRLNSAAGSP
jgi:hypothetical protein